MPAAADTDFRIIDLPPFRFAMARGFGEAPEMMAWSTLLEWAERQGVEPRSGEHRFFGFNDPSPSEPGEPYGYQQWMTIDVEVEADPHEEVSVGEFTGGRFATTRCHGIGQIGEKWMALYEFVKKSELTPTHEPGLEELLTDITADPTEYVFDLFLPITGA